MKSTMKPAPVNRRMRYLAALAIAAATAFSAVAAAADAATAACYGGADGRPFWNSYSRMFTFPPAFDFSKGGPGTVKYRFKVFDSAGKVHVFDAPSANSPLTPVWDKVAPGQTWVYLSAVDAEGKEHGIPDWPRERFQRTFWRAAPFRPGAYPPAPRSYADAAAKFGDQIFEFSPSQSFLKTGKPDPEFKHDCYPSRTYSAFISAMLGYAKRRPDRAADAVKIAESAADYLVSRSYPAGTPLAHMPPTYGDRREAGSFRYGQVMMNYPCAVGSAYLDVYGVTGEKRRLEDARRIADTYLKLQAKDGSWPVLVRAEDGKDMREESRLMPIPVISFLDRLSAVSGEAKYGEAAARGFAWVETVALKDWAWEGQFEDTPLISKYENLSVYPACDIAIYMLGRFPNDAKRRAVARALLTFAEDQFVCWEKPCAANGHGVSTPFGAPNGQQNRYDDWYFPCAMEQYVYYVPVNASCAKVIGAFLAMYRAEGNPLDLAKAKALGDSLVRIQRPSGYIPTEYAKVEIRDEPMKSWLSCSCETLQALVELSEIKEK